MRLNKTGFTLIELLIAMAISNILILSAFKFFSAQQQKFKQEKNILDLHQKSRIIMEIISRTILKAGYNLNPASNNLYPLDKESDQTRLRLYSDFNKNNKIDKTGGEDITFKFDSEKEEIKKNNKPLAHNITELKFNYDLPPPRTKSIQIIFTARAEKENPNYHQGYNLKGKKEDGTCPTLTLNAQLYLRNNPTNQAR